MLIVQVKVRVKPGCEDTFKKATLENARQSLQESGIARFDVLQQLDDPTQFILIEVYRDQDAPARHKETAHYQLWRDTVAALMAEPRSSLRYANLFPPHPGWNG